MMAHRIIPLLIITSLGLSCAYYNTLYNATRYFSEAEKEILRMKEGDKLSRKTEDALDKVIEKTTSVLQKYPQSNYRDDALFLMARALYYRKDMVRARDTFQRLVTEEPDSPFTSEAGLWLVRCKWKLGDPYGALAELKRLTGGSAESSRSRARRNQALIHETAADIYLDLAKPDSSIHEYELSAAFSRKERDKARIYFKIAELAFDESIYETALEYYQMVLNSSSDPDHIESAHLQTIKILRIQERWDEAAAKIQELLPNDKFADIRPQLNLELAKLYQTQSMIKQALSRYSLLTEEFPRTSASAEAYYQLGTLTLQTSSDYGKAKDYFSKVEKEKRSSLLVPSARTRVKEIESIIKVLDEIAALERELEEERLKRSPPSGADEPGLETASTVDSLPLPAADLQMDHADTIALLTALAGKLCDYGELLAFHFGQPDSGIHVFERLVSEMPTSPRRAQALFSLAHLYNEGGEEDLAQKCAHRLVNEYPRTEYAESVARSLGIEIHDEAETILQEAEKLGREDPNAALTMYKKIVEEHSSSRFILQALMAMGYTYDYQLNDLENSLRMYGRLIEDYPDSEQARFVQDRYRQLLALQQQAQSDTLQKEESQIEKN